MTCLFIQIPCLNEADNIANTIKTIPRAINGISDVKILIVDDGSTDDTVAKALEAGANHIYSLPSNRGLAVAFNKGLEECVRLGADIIVNFDGDNQYKADDIERLVAPIIANKADIVIGARRLGQSDNYNATKKTLHKIGTKVVKQLTHYDISDPVTGFRAFSRQTAIEMNIYSSFSYTTETLIAASFRKKRLVEIQVDTNETQRPSRLFRSIPHFVVNTAVTIIRTYAMYRPLRFFGGLGLLSTTLGLIPIVRFFILYIIHGNVDGKLQSLTLGGMFFVTGILFFSCAILADMVAHNRRTNERILLKMKEKAYNENH